MSLEETITQLEVNENVSDTKQIIQLLKELK